MILRGIVSFSVCLIVLSLVASEDESSARREVDFGALEGIVRLAGDEVPSPISVENTTDPTVCGQTQTLADLLVSGDNRGIQNVVIALTDVPLEFLSRFSGRQER